MRMIKCRHCGAENDANAKTCDDCGKYLSGSGSVARADPHWGRCSWESDGMRCANAGTLADSTTGTDRWYCAGHHGCGGGAIGHQIVLESLRRDSNPDFGLDARRQASLSKANAMVPKNLRGGTVEDYRHLARSLLGKFMAKAMPAKSGKF